MINQNHHVLFARLVRSLVASTSSSRTSHRRERAWLSGSSTEGASWPWKLHRCWVWLVSLQPELRACRLSTVVTANRVHHATPSLSFSVCKQTHYDDTRRDNYDGWRNGPSGRTFGWRDWQDRRRQISFHDVFQKEPASVAVKIWTWIRSVYNVFDAALGKLWG